MRETHSTHSFAHTGNRLCTLQEVECVQAPLQEVECVQASLQEVECMLTLQQTQPVSQTLTYQDAYAMKALLHLITTQPQKMQPCQFPAIRHDS